ncbi:GMC family oxidoreductase N-terminal domain-containing protein [Pseudonocardia sp.]|uniref:GMC family oxidoreductase n=1 Tax=Pseudonocardia sp. TaxID=60912 RepID=UPI002602E37A|nr:GMC family oxidoreductase N-terminal domain-containing protein [Pseudonocardia sp.]
MLGGTSCLNAMQYIRGHHSDFDAWAEAGPNPGWSYADVLPHFVDLEDNEGGASPYHGVGGPVHVSTLRDKDHNPTSEAFVAACLERGYPANDDFNGATSEGAGFGPVSIKERVRQDTWTCLLAPVAGRDGLTVRTGASVARLLVEGDRVTGVELASGERILAGREVIVCAGAIDSPRLLLRSGIGPADELRAVGVDVVHDLPGVGRNLHDHVLLGVVYEAAQPLPPGRNNLSESVLFTHSSLRASRGLPAPDIQVALVHVPFHSPEFTAPANSYTIAPGIVYPRSRGSVRLLPDGGLAIDPNYLADDADVVGLIEGIALSREVGAARAFAPWRAREVLPGPDVTSDAALREFVAKAASTYYHPAGTCAMGTGADAVVDPELRVRGLQGLRIADASIMPFMVGVNPNAAITMIGSKAASLVTGVEPRVAANLATA